MRRSVIVLAAVAAALPSAGAAGATSAPSAGPSPRAVSAAVQRWLASEQTAVVRAGATALAPAKRSPILSGGFVPTQNAALVPAGDLNGDHHADLIDFRQTPESFTVPPTSRKVGLTARDGRTGKVLWDLAGSEHPNEQLSILPAKLGAKSKPGLLVIQAFPLYTTSQDNVEDGVTLTMAALSGRAGHELWTHTFSGSFANDGSQASIPSFDGVIHDAKGPTADLLVSLETTLPAPGGDRTTPQIVSGADGTVHTPGAPFISAAGFAFVTPVPHPTRHGSDDLLAAVPGSPGYAELERGHSGAKVWKTTLPNISADDTATTVLGHYSSAKVSDVGISSFNGTTFQTDNTVLRGKNGHVLWTRPGGGLYLLGKAGKHLVPAVGIATNLDKFPSATKTIDQFHYEAVSTSNKVLYKKTHTVSVVDPPNKTNDAEGGRITPVGDVQPDGSLEQNMQLLVLAGSSTTTVSKDLDGIINGRTGTLHKVAFDDGSAGSLQKGPATDLLAVTLAKKAPFITASDGATTKPLYRRRIAELPASTYAWISGLRVTGQPCSDINLATTGAETNSASILTARGAVLWTVTFTSTQVEGGTRTRHQPPKHDCVS